MASGGSEASCVNDPNFAIICSFFEKFSSMINIQQPDIQLLQEWLENTDEVAPGLRNLHVKLLRKMRKTVHETAWETALVKFCYLYSSQDAWEVERFGYKKSSLKVKLRILTAILEYQFQLNGKFRNKFANMSAEELRSEPIGRDRSGHSYWLTQDPSCNFRIYQEHLDEEIWQVVASNRSEMETLITRLKGNEVVLPSLIGIIDEDSSSNSCANTLIKPPPPEEQDDSQSSSASSNTRLRIPSLRIKLDSPAGKIIDSPNGGRIVKKEEDEVEDDDEDEEDEDSEVEEDGEEEEDEEEEEEDNETEEDEKVEEQNMSTPGKRRGRPPKSATNGSIKAVKEEKIKIVAGEEPMEGVEEDGTDTEVTPRKRRGRPPRNSIQNGNTSAETNGIAKPAAITNGRRSTSQRAKPPTVSQSKPISSVDVKSNGKRRTISHDANDDSETDKPTAKKSRPTLLDNRCDKKSKYEKSSGEEEEDDEDADDEDDAEEEADEGEEEVEDEEEEEVDDDEEAEDDADEEDEADETTEEKDENLVVEKEEKSKSENVKKVDIKEEKKPEAESEEKKEKPVAKDDKDDAKVEEMKDEKTEVKAEQTESKKDEKKEEEKDEKEIEEKDEKDEKQMEENTTNSTAKEEEIKDEKVEVSEAVEEKLMIVQGEGSGKECESASTLFFRDLDLNCAESEEFVGEEIEETVMYVYGEGSGMESLVGNQHEETSKNDSILLEHSQSINIQSKDALTTKPIKSDKNENSESSACLMNGTEATSEKDGQSFKADSKNSNNSTSPKAKQSKNEKTSPSDEDASPKKSKNSVSNKPTSPDVISEKCAKTVAPKSKRSASGNARGKCEKAESDGKVSDPKEYAQPKDDSPKSPSSEKPPEKVAHEDSKETKVTKKSLSKEPDTPATADEASADSQENGATNTRKRRLSEEKAQNFSESESELNSDSAAPPTEEDEDVGGKRLKMRPKTVNAELRKKVETARKSNERHSSSEEESSTQDNNAEKPEDLEEKDPLQISDNELITAKGIIESSPKLPTPVLIQTRTTRHTPAGTPIKVIPPKSRGRKLTKNTTEATDAETPTRKPEQRPIEEEKAATTSGDPPAAEEEDAVKEELEENGPSDGKAAAQRKPRSRKRDIETSNIIDVHGDTPVRQSRRIAQLKIREEADRRKMEEEALKKMKAEFKKKKKEEKTSKGIPVPESESEATQEDSEAEAGKKAIAKKKGLRGKNGRWSSGPEDEPEEDDEYDLHHDRYESERGSPLFKSDHEFSPESDIEDESQVVPLKRARTARQEGAENDDESLDESCQKCGKKDHPEWILLCDKCDKGYHCSCLSPVLFIIPEGEWFCPPCQQDQLIGALENRLTTLDGMVEQKRIREEEEARHLELEQKRKEVEEEEAHGKESDCAEKRKKSKAKKSRAERAKRRRNPKTRKAYIDDDDEETDETDSESGSSGSDSSSEDSQTGSRSTSKSSDDSDEPIYKLRKRRQVNVSYRLNEYEDLINSAIKEEMDEVAGAGNLGRGKDISTIIEADKEEKLRQRKLSVFKENDETAAVPENEVKEEIKTEDASGKERDEDDDEEDTIRPVKTKSKQSSKRLHKKGRKLNNLDVSSDDDGSDEDFKTSSYETDEDESISEATDSDSSLEVYRRRGKKGKRGKKDRGRRPQRRAVRERKRLDDFIVEDESDGSGVIPKRRKVKRKHNWELQDTESEEDLSEQIDSEELCDDTTDSEDSDGCWRPSNKRRKTKKASKANSSSSLGTYGGKQPRKFHKKDSGDRSSKGKSKNKARRNRDTDDSDEDVPRTRGKRFTYLDSFDEDSSDDGIKPGVKRPDTPPEEREKFIKKQEEIKRMLAEKNTEAAKAVATPTLAPVDSLSTVPLSVIKGAKALDIDYLQRKGELNSDDDGETDFDEDLPDDFDPEAMDEEEIAKMMEEEDFAQQQLKVTGDVFRQKKKDEQPESKIVAPVIVPVTKEPPPSLLQEPPRKRLPMPTFHPPLGNASRFVLPSHRIPYEPPIRQPLQSTVPLSTQSVIQTRPVGSAMGVGVGQMAPVINAPPQAALHDQSSTNESQKPRGRRKKITPLRDTLQKQQAAAAAAAAAAVIPSIPAASVICAAITPTVKEITAVISSEKPAAVGPTGLSVAQPPQLYTPPVSTPPSVITRMPQSQSQVPPRAQPPVLAQQQQHGPPPRPPYPDQNPRFYPPPPNQMPPHRMSIIRHGAPMPQHHTLGPSFAGGPPPLRPASPRLPVSVANAANRQPSPRPMAFSPNNQYAGNRTQPPPPPPPHSNPPPHAYRPPLYGTPGYPPAPPQQSQTPMHPTGPDYSAVPTPYGPTPYGGPYYPPQQNIAPPHPTPPPTPAATSVVPVSSAISPPSMPVPVPTPPAPVASVVVAPPTSPAIPVQSVAVTTPVSAETSLVISQPPPSSVRPNASVLETFDSKSRSPILETDGRNSPYSNSGEQDDDNEEDNGDSVPGESTSEFSGLVSYFSSQHDDLNS